MRVLNKKKSICQDNLQIWNRATCCHVRITLTKKLKELFRLEETGLYQSNPNRILQLRDEIQLIQNKEETLWKQWSHNDWLKDGDSNKKFFHCKDNQRNKHNFILGLEDDHGVWVEDEGQMGITVKDYFAGIFTSSNPTLFEDILEGILPTVTTNMNASLNHEFQVVEVQQALQLMGPLTTPRPYDMSPIFYKSF